MDITNVFLDAAVKYGTAEQQEKLRNRKVFAKTEKSAGPKGTYTKTALEVENSIKEMLGFIENNRRAYLGVETHSMQNGGNMTDQDKDEIDAQTRAFVKSCGDSIDQLKETIQKGVSQPSAHKHGVAMYLYERLADVTRISEQMRSIRLQHMLANRERASRSAVHASKAAESFVDDSVQESSSGIDDDANGLSREERMMLEEENQSLFNELDTLVDQVREAEKKLIEIASLSQIFSEKVLEQSKQIDMMYDLAVESTENVNVGNKNLEQAMSHNVDFRLFVLMFLFIASFGLLFLDWYTS